MHDSYLEVNYTAGLSGRVVTVVGQCFPLAIKHEPSFVPMMKLLAHLRQVTAATCRIDHDIINQGQLMPGSFYVMPQIEGLGFDGQISRERPLKAT